MRRGPMDKDRNLLFGVIAVQFRKVTPAQLVETAGAWAIDPSKELPQRLVDAGILSEPERKHLEVYVDEVVMAHGEDSRAALDSIQQAGTVQDSINTICRTLEGTVPPDLTKPSHTRWLEIGPMATVPAVEETPGRYTHPSEYARGGVGRVLLVHDQHLGRDIALKELLPIVQSDGSTIRAGDHTPVQLSLSLVARFLQEARITGQLEHPSIVPVYELGRRKDGTIYYTMKLVRGTTLTTSLKQATTLKDRLRLLPNFLDLCNAIGYAHSRGIIHRDIKPNNVMIGEFGETVVLDWGLAKIRGQEDAHADELEHTLRTLQLSADAKAVETADGQVLGTPVFMPPEQARGEIESITERSDVYSLGAVLYSILAGQFPYSGRSAAEVLQQVLNQEPPAVESIEPAAPPELVAICKRAMQRDADKRYASGKEIAEEVSRFLTGALVGAYEYSFGEHLARFVKRHRASLSTAAACLVALLVLAVFSYVQISQERTAAVEARNNEEEQRLLAVEARDSEQAQRIRAEQELYTANVLLARDRIEEHRFDLAEPGLDAAPAAYRDWEWAYLKRLCHQDAWTFRGHTHIVENISLSADGSTMLTASDDGTARVVDAATGQELRVLATLDTTLVSAQINAPGTHGLVHGSDNSLGLYDVGAGSLIASLDGHADTVRVAQFSPDGNWILTASFDGLTQRWDAGTGGKLWTAPGPPQLNDAVISGDGKYVAEAGVNGPLVLLDAQSGAVIGSVEVQPAPLNKAVFHPGGQHLAVAHGSTLTVLGVPGLEAVFTLEAGGSDIVTLVFNADGTRIATGLDNGAVTIWDAGSGTRLVALEGHLAPVTEIAFDDKQNALITASRDFTVRMWRTDTGQELRTLEGHSGAICGMRFHPDSEAVWTASEDRTVKRWNVSADAESAVTHLHGHSDDIRSLEFGEGNRTLLSVSRDGTACLWALPGDAEPWTLRPEKGEILCASLNSDGKHVATGATDNSIRVLSIETKAEQSQLAKHTGPVSGVRFSPVKAQVLSVSWDNTAILWNVENGTPLYQKEIVEGRRGLGAFSPDGTRVALPTANNGVTLVDTDSGALSTQLAGHGQRVTSFAFSADSQKLLTTSLDETARVWNVADGALLFALEGHGTGVMCGVFSPDGASIATGTADGLIRLWDASSGQLLHTTAGHSATVVGLAYTGTSRRLFSVSEDGTVRLWNPAGQVEMLRFSIGRPYEGDVFLTCSGQGIASSWNRNGIAVR